jgi:hypothetical protein
MLCPIKAYYYVHLTFSANNSVPEQIWQRKFADAIESTTEHTNSLFPARHKHAIRNYRLHLSKHKSWRSMYAAIHGPDPNG